MSLCVMPECSGFGYISPTGMSKSPYCAEHKREHGRKSDKKRSPTRPRPTNTGLTQTSNAWRGCSIPGCDRPRYVAASGLSAHSKCREHSNEALRRGALYRKYGLVWGDYTDLLARQGGGCAVCGRRPQENEKLVVDHDHDSGRVRGLLCRPCNVLLGMAHDDTRVLACAAEYLRCAEAYSSRG